MKGIIFVFCLFSFSCFSQVDSVVFCLSNKGVPGLYLSKVNLNTGVVSYISPNVIGTGVTGNGAAINPYSQVYYFCDGPNQITTLDLSTGTIVANAPITNTDTFDQLVFNASDSVIYGLARTYNPPGVYLGKIDPSTGLVTRISAISLSQGNLMSSATIDPFTKIYYYINEANAILGVDLNTGNIISNAAITNIMGQYFDLMQFNPSDKFIYGLARRSNPPEVYLAKIDPFSGVVTNLSMTSLSNAVSSSGSILDPCRNNYYYIQEGGLLRGANCSMGINGIVTVAPSSQILEMRFNYKCHLDFNFISDQSNVDASIYPNPSSDHLNLKGINEYGIIVEVSDALGQIVLTSLEAKQIDVSTWAKGCYFVKIISPKRNQHLKFIKE